MFQLLRNLWWYFYRIFIGLVLLSSGLMCLSSGISLFYIEAYESRGDLQIDEVPVTNRHLAELPKNAEKIRWSYQYRGSGGRFVAFKYQAEVLELHHHAILLMQIHKAKKHNILIGNLGNFNRDYLNSVKLLSSTNVEWMLPVAGHDFILYEDPKPYTSHQAQILIDETAGVLFFLMHD